MFVSFTIRYLSPIKVGYVLMLKTEELFFFLVLEETYGEKIYVVRRHCYASEVGLTNMVVSVHEDVNVNKVC